MRTFKTRGFHDWAHRAGLSDATILQAVKEIDAGLVEAALGGHVFKKRVPLPGRGKRGGARILVAYRSGCSVFAIYGFSKNERRNVSARAVTALQKLAVELLSYDVTRLNRSVAARELIEVVKDEQKDPDGGP